MTEKTILLQAMSDAEKKAALRFCETCDDDECYDVPRQMMKRLETLGLVIDKKFGRFEQTELLLDVRGDLEAWAFSDVITTLVATADAELMALEEAELAAQWCWRWEEGRSIEWNTYKFSDMLEMHKRQCRRWEERHNGSCCVVERVRDKYLMPRVREFLAALATHNADLCGGEAVRTSAGLGAGG